MITQKPMYACSDTDLYKFRIDMVKEAKKLKKNMTKMDFFKHWESVHKRRLTLEDYWISYKSFELVYGCGIRKGKELLKQHYRDMFDNSVVGLAFYVFIEEIDERRFRRCPSKWFTEYSSFLQMHIQNYDADVKDRDFEPAELATRFDEKIDELEEISSFGGWLRREKEHGPSCVGDIEITGHKNKKRNPPASNDESCDEEPEEHTEDEECEDEEYEECENEIIVVV